MARHSKLIIFYLTLQRVSQYLEHLITTDRFLRLYTSVENGSRVAAQAPGLSKQVQREPRLADIARESQGMLPATTIMLKGRVDAMASTGRKPYILQRQTATWNRTRLQTYCWPVYAIRALVLLLVTNTN